MKLELNVKQNLQLHINQELKMAIKLLSLSNLELVEYINEEAERNVILESLSEENTKLEALIKIQEDNRIPLGYEKDMDPEERNYEAFISEKLTLTDFLYQQISTFKIPPKLSYICHKIIDNLDDSGYFINDYKDFAGLLNVSLMEFYEGLQIVKSLEPEGIASKDLKECLLAQTENPLLRKLINKHLENIAKNKLKDISRDLKISIEETGNLIAELKELNPIPSSGYLSDTNPVQYIVPELEIKTENGEIKVNLINEVVKELNFSDQYLDMLKNSEGETKTYLEKQFKRALFLKDALEQRKNNILKIGNSLAKFQKDFFLLGKELKPLTMKTLADDCEISESTVSRICSNKYLDCNKGIFPMKHFFSRAISTKDGDLSSKAIKDKISLLIASENKKKPLSDNEIMKILNNEGIEIKRRTIAKYREDLGIASSSQRKIFN